MRHSRQTWRQFRQVERQYRHFTAMVDKLGIAPIEAARFEGGRGLAVAQRTCLDCRHEDLCERWLDAAIVLKNPPPFCPNARFLAACRKASVTPL